MITLVDYFMGRDERYRDELTDEITRNASRTVVLANELIAAYREHTGDSEPRTVNSGWRPVAVNAATANAAPRSKHMLGQAIDLSDPEGDLDEWCLAHPARLAELGLWQEHPASTKGWCHVQIVPPKSGNRVFYP